MDRPEEQLTGISGHTAGAARISSGLPTASLAVLLPLCYFHGKIERGRKTAVSRVFNADSSDALDLSLKNDCCVRTVEIPGRRKLTLHARHEPCHRCVTLHATPHLPCTPHYLGTEQHIRFAWMRKHDEHKMKHQEIPCAAPNT